MKKLILFIYLLPLFGFTQIKLDTIGESIYYSKVFSVNKTKQSLHQKASEWIAINFKDSKSVIKLDTPNKIITKGFFKYSPKIGVYIVNYDVYFILEVGFKEKKYKIDFNNFEFKYSNLTIPLYFYFKVKTRDDYIKMLERLRALTKRKLEKNYYKKLLDNPKRLNKRYFKFKKDAENIRIGFSSLISTYAKSLNIYINKESSDSW